MTKRRGTSSGKARIDQSERHPLITAAEARGEAAYLLMQLLVRRLPQSMRKSLMMESYLAAGELDIPAITEEVESIFWGIPDEPPTR